LASLIIGVIFFVTAVSGFFLADHKKWARIYFWATLFYLPLQLGVLLVLH